MRGNFLIPFTLVWLGLACLPAGQREALAVADGILATRHNLSVSGPGQVKAVSEVRVCIFCHTPHHASDAGPLWDRPASVVVYRVYSSSTGLARPGQPTGSSRLCLSCHDGTVAVGALAGGNPNLNSIEMVGGFTKIPAGSPGNLGGNAGNDLTNDHPVSFPYSNNLADKNRQLRTPSLVPRKLKLDANENLQCTTCHNPHLDPYGKFLVMSNAKSALCTGCHLVSGWQGSGHADNAATAEQGCGNCHLPHNARTAKRLLKESPEEANCLGCHAPAGVARDIQTALSNAYRHPVQDYFGVHDAAESPLSAQKHVECEDCHNPHAVNRTSATAPRAGGSLNGVTGVSFDGVVQEAVNEYEVCFRCHADNNFSGQTVVRQIQQVNSRLDFATDNPSFHPVQGPGVNGNVPSLRLGYATSSTIYCTDCHGSDQSLKAGGSGPNGPHGSRYKYILLKNYETERYPLPYDDSYYALCYRCHDPNILLSAASPFFETAAGVPLHELHVRGKGVPCFICHDPHGVSRTRGSSSANAHLINFEVRVTGSYNASGTPKSCTVSCHSSNPRSYGPGSSGGAGKLRQQRRAPAK
jgi:predicted CXXCH cytochrome family protein